MTRRLIWNSAKYGFGIAMLAYVIWRYWKPNDPLGLKQTLGRPIQFVPLMWCGIIYLTGLLLTLYRWYLLVRALDLPFTVRNGFRLGLVGFSLSTFLPGSVGGDIIKAAFIAREQKNRRTAAVATVLIDRGVGLWGLFWLVALIGGSFWASGEPVILQTPDLQSIILFCITIIGISVAVWIGLGFLPDRRAEIFAGRLSRLPKVGTAARELWKAVWMYRSRSKWIAASVVLSILSHFCFVLSFYAGARTFADPSQPDQLPSLLENFLIVPVGMAVQALPLAPGGVGIGEAAFGKLYEIVHKQGASGVLSSLAQRIVTWSWGVIGYLVYLRMRPELRQLAQEQATL